MSCGRLCLQVKTFQIPLYSFKFYQSLHLWSLSITQTLIVLNESQYLFQLHRRKSKTWIYWYISFLSTWPVLNKGNLPFRHYGYWYLIQLIKPTEELWGFIWSNLLILVDYFLLHRYAKNGGKPFFYYFIHQSSVNPWPAWMGVMHGYEIEFVFGIPLNPSLGYTQQEVNMSKRFMSYWANFARTGYPLTHKCSVTRIAWEPQKGLLNSFLSFRNPDGNGNNWPLFTPENKEYVILDTKAPENKLDLRANECEFWNTLLPQIRMMEGKDTSTDTHTLGMDKASDSWMLMPLLHACTLMLMHLKN